MNPTSANWKFFSPITNVTKVSTAMCAAAFDELEVALAVLGAARDELNPVQVQLVDRFVETCKLFGRDMMAADGDRDALGKVLGPPATPKRSNATDTVG